MPDQLESQTTAAGSEGAWASCLGFDSLPDELRPERTRPPTMAGETLGLRARWGPEPGQEACSWDCKCPLRRTRILTLKQQKQ